MLEIISIVIFYIVLIAICVINFRHYMHMFQLNSYHANEQLKWMGINIGSVIIRHIFTIASIVTLLICNDVKASTLLIASGFICFNGAFVKAKKAKKKLVFTPRVIRMCVTWGIIFTAVMVLVPLFMGFTPLSMIILCLMQIVNLFGTIIANVINKPIEAGVNRHYINDAKRIIKELPDLTVVGLTGSYGKTSTKFYLEKLLSAKYRVLMTPESYNTTMGVVKVVRGSLNATHEIFLCEMGAKGVGEIKEICDIVHPKHGIITSIGPAHLEMFKSMENIVKTKFELADSLPDDGMIVLNYDNDYIRNNPCDKIKITYGLKGDADYTAEVLSVSEKGTQFIVRHGDESREFTTKLIGENNVQNIVGAIAISHSLGVSFDELALPVKRLECVPHRLQIIKGANSVIIDDAFNSNPNGAKAALDTLAVFDGYKVLVSPGMVELGEKEYELNEKFGMQAAQVCDFCIAVGERQAVPIKAGLLKAGYPEDKIYVAKDLKDALAKADNLKTGGKKKIILLENDLPDNY